MRIIAHGSTDVGLHRGHNEDSYLVDKKSSIFVVADGLGGHNAGEVASQMFIEEVGRQTPWVESLLETHRLASDEGSRQRILGYLPRIIEQANERIFLDAQRTPGRRGMATTAVLFLPAGDEAFICHVGDSRLYLFRDGKLFRATEDHSLVMQLFKRGHLTEEEIETHPQKNVILRSIGSQPTVEVDTVYLDLLSGDKFLLCTDGLSDMVSEEELADLMAGLRGEELVKQCIDAAKRNGGHDNITVVVVELLDDEAGIEETDSISQQPQQLGALEKVEFLQDIFLFSDLSNQECLKVNRILYQRDYDVRESIIREGEEGDELYVVARGQVEIWRNQTHLTSIGPGGHFGELGMMGREVRSATVEAGEEACSLLVIRRDDFLKLLQDDPALGNKVLWAFLENLADRLRDLSGRLAGGRTRPSTGPGGMRSRA